MRIQSQAGKLTVGLILSLLAVAPAFAKHVRQFDFDKAVSVNGKQLTPGKYNVIWETHSPQATITIAHKKDVLVTTTGTVVERPKAYDSDSIVYSTEPDGSLTLVELRFAGSNKVLTFDNSSPTGRLMSREESTVAAAMKWKVPVTSLQRNAQPLRSKDASWQDFALDTMMYDLFRQENAKSAAVSPTQGRTFVVR